MELVRLEDDSFPVWEVRHTGRVVGTVSLGAGSVPSAWHLRLQVHPDFRLRGIGSWLLVTATEAARSAGCRTLETMVVRGSPGEGFAARRGAVIGDELIDAMLDMDRADLAALTTFAAGVPDSHQITGWCDPTPGRFIDSYASVKRVVSEAPNRFPPPTPRWTTTEFRRAEQRCRERGARLWVGACLYANEVVAFTEVSTTTSPQGEQHDTGVLAEHRRQGLARAVKAALILRLRAERPDVRTIAATYAAANTGMRAVNRDLGFQERRCRDLVRLPI